MPATSKRHANITSFKKGQKAYNKGATIQKICLQCSKIFYVQQNDLNFRPCKCCSKLCDSKYRTENSKYKDLISLKENGMTTRELSEYYHVSTITINSVLNRRKYRAPIGKSYGSIRKRILYTKEQKCCICGFDRCIELAHVVRASEGGGMTVGNTIVLCPNHHKLFDSEQLTSIEQIKLNEVIKCLPCRPKLNTA